jgi:plasmid stabilization system protein ParE
MQTYKVILSAFAKSDLQHIVSYLSSTENITVAKRVERGILSEMKRLTHFPEAYPKDEYATTETHTVRFIIKWNYKILYCIEAAAIYIIGIFHTAQNPKRLKGFPSSQ